MFRSKLSDLLVSAGLAILPKPAPLPASATLLGFAALAAWCYGLVKVTDRDREAINNHGAHIDAINMLVAEPIDGETFGAFKARCPRAKIARMLWPVPDDARWNGAIFVAAPTPSEIAEEVFCPSGACGSRPVPPPDPYGIGRELLLIRKMLAEGKREMSHYDCEQIGEVTEAALRILEEDGWTVERTQPRTDSENGRTYPGKIKFSRPYTACNLHDANRYASEVATSTGKI